MQWGVGEGGDGDGEEQDYTLGRKDGGLAKKLTHTPPPFPRTQLLVEQAVQASEAGAMQLQLAASLLQAQAAASAELRASDELRAGQADAALQLEVLEERLREADERAVEAQHEAAAANARADAAEEAAIALMSQQQQAAMAEDSAASASRMEAEAEVDRVRCEYEARLAGMRGELEGVEHAASAREAELMLQLQSVREELERGRVAASSPAEQSARDRSAKRGGGRAEKKGGFGRSADAVPSADSRRQQRRVQVVVAEPSVPAHPPTSSEAEPQRALRPVVVVPRIGDFSRPSAAFNTGGASPQPTPSSPPSSSGEQPQQQPAAASPSADFNEISASLRAAREMQRLQDAARAEALAAARRELMELQSLLG